ncbi:hypothetical protein [Sphingomonas piscis]|nr:hypothetical protein [Sphingomonas piscis]
MGWFSSGKKDSKSTSKAEERHVDREADRFVAGAFLSEKEKGRGK